MDDEDRKRRYAYCLLMEPGEFFKAGLAAFPEQDNYHRHRAMAVAMEWQDSIDIAMLKRQLELEHGAEFFLPSKGDLAREVWKNVKNGKTGEKLVAAKLYGELMGFIEKPAQAVINNTNTQTVNKVMVVPTSGSEDDWERKLVEQQQKLIEHAA